MKSPSLRLLGLMLLTVFVGSSTVATAIQPVSANEEFEVGIKGMTDEKACVAKVQKALAGVKGVTAVTVDFKAKRATVKAPATLKKADLKSALEKAGYGLSSFEKLEPPKSYRLEIQGMKEASCAAKVRKALGALKGVDSVVIDLASGVASVTMKRKAELAEAAVKKGLPEPYKLSSIKES